MNDKELKKLSSYKDLAYRSLRFLYNHPQIGEIKLEIWVYSWMKQFRRERLKEEEAEGNVAEN